MLLIALCDALLQRLAENDKLRPWLVEGGESACWHTLVFEMHEQAKAYHG